MMARSALAFLVLLPSLTAGQQVRDGAAAFGDWRSDGPGVIRRILPADMPPPNATRSASDFPSVDRRPDGALPRVPAGFKVALIASGLDMPRTLRTAPNGDVFVAESGAGAIRVLRRGAAPAVFTDRLSRPFGIAFWPTGADPQYLYVAETGRVVRFPYRSGDTRARGPAETVIPNLPQGGHWTRDIVFSPDGSRLYVSVGSDSNLGGGMASHPPDGFVAAHAYGAAWGEELGRAAVLVTTQNGANPRLFATGLRNCSAEAIEPSSGQLWCAVNERDGLGDDLPPDYVTAVRDGGFYGWPWFYIGAHPDPRLTGLRPDLAQAVTVPDVLIQPHSAPLGLTFYEGSQFPAPYRGDAFVALHGSWNRGRRTGYKVVRILFRDGKPTGEYEDFLTGFVASSEAVWGRPVGVAVDQEGALLVSEDANGTIWRVTATK